MVGGLRSCRIAAVAIEEKIGTRYGRRYIGYINCSCLETDRPGGWPSKAGVNSSPWDSDIQRAFYNGWKSIWIILKD